jgi:WD40 repeat protein
LLAAALDGGEVMLWSTATDKQVGSSLPVKTDLGQVGGIAFSPDGRTLATAGSDWTIRLWNVDTHAQLGAPLRDSGPVTSVAFSPDGKTLASASYAAVRLWNVRSHAELGPPLNTP